MILLFHVTALLILFCLLFLFLCSFVALKFLFLCNLSVRLLCCEDGPKEFLAFLLRHEILTFMRCTTWQNKLTNKTQSCFVRTACTQVKLKDALNNLFTSPAWEEMKNTGEKIKHRLHQRGFSAAWEEFVISLDPEGETHAYRVSVCCCIVVLRTC